MSDLRPWGSRPLKGRETQKAPGRGISPHGALRDGVAGRRSSFLWKDDRKLDFQFDLALDVLLSPLVNHANDLVHVVRVTLNRQRITPERQALVFGALLTCQPWAEACSTAFLDWTILVESLLYTLRLLN